MSMKYFRYEAYGQAADSGLVKAKNKSEAKEKAARIAGYEMTVVESIDLEQVPASDLDEIDKQLAD